MAKIVSRANDAQALEELKAALVQHSMGAISHSGMNGIAQVADDLPGLTEQTSAVLQAMKTTLEAVAFDLSISRSEASRYAAKIDELEAVVECLLEDVSFDGALDAAAIDLMDSISSGGSATTNLSGDLIFDERTVVSKSGIKSAMQRAITVWIEQRLSA